MRKTVVFSVLSALVFGSSLLSAAPSAKSGSGSIVIVFRDGHRESFNLAEIERIEFSGGATASSGESGALRGRFLGKWEVGDGNGNTFYITLNEGGGAFRTLGDVHGHWSYVNGEAQIVWDDGAQDAIRRTGSRYQKFAYSAGKSFTDTPDNVTPAHNLTPKPI